MAAVCPAAVGVTHTCGLALELGQLALRQACRYAEVPNSNILVDLTCN